jgi:glycine/D-amino acid oxidase-like deaminating enzyme
MDKNIDIHIVGGGISGRLAQLELQARGKSTLVLDAPEANHCSAVAAGLANPVIGKYFSVGWRVEDFFADFFAAGFLLVAAFRITRFAVVFRTVFFVVFRPEERDCVVVFLVAREDLFFPVFLRATIPPPVLIKYNSIA